PRPEARSSSREGVARARGACARCASTGGLSPQPAGLVDVGERGQLLQHPRLPAPLDRDLDLEPMAVAAERENRARLLERPEHLAGRALVAQLAEQDVRR